MANPIFPGSPMDPNTWPAENDLFGPFTGGDINSMNAYSVMKALGADDGKKPQEEKQSKQEKPNTSMYELFNKRVSPEPSGAAWSGSGF